jgi:hypothetical protein
MEADEIRALPLPAHNTDAVGQAQFVILQELTAQLADMNSKIERIAAANWAQFFSDKKAKKSKLSVQGQQFTLYPTGTTP